MIGNQTGNLSLGTVLQVFRSKILPRKRNISMATGNLEYVRSYEVQDAIALSNTILVRLSGRNFTRFSELHEFEKPYDEKALGLMNACALRVMDVFPEIVIGYGFNDEYSFAFKTDTGIYQRRASKFQSIIGSLFSSAYVINWKEFFPHKELKSPPSFRSRVIPCESMEVLQEYLSWRQKECHSRNLYDTCLWKLIDSGKSQMEAKEILEDLQEQALRDLLLQQFDLNYECLPDVLRLGSFLIKNKVDVIVEDKMTGKPVTRLRRRVKVVHAENVEAPSFLNGHSCLVDELGLAQGEINKLNPKYLKSFVSENSLPADWIVVRIDGCHFHSFCEIHEFVKPNDEQAANLMNESAKAVMREFDDIVFSYGYSDEYSFVLKKDTSLFGRRASEIVSAFVSLFSSVYVMLWDTYFTKKALVDPPHFDGRAICYPSTEILLDYLAWRQIDCHRSNKYNTCFWFLVNKSGMSRRRATKAMQGFKTQQKNDFLIESGIDYKSLPAMFRHGSSIFWDKEETGTKKLVVEHSSVINKDFWMAHPNIFEQRVEERLKDAVLV